MPAKGKYIAFLIIVVMTVSACSSGSEDSTEHSNAATPTSLSKFPAFDGELDFTYVPETDAQSNRYDGSGIAYTNNGMYMLSNQDGGMLSDLMLSFYDYATGQTVYVCSKSNCTHNGVDCDAYFRQEEYPIKSLWYQEGYLYVVKIEEDYLCLEKVSLDGSIREKCCTLMRLNIQTRLDDSGIEESWIVYPEIQLHRGYAYYSTYYPGDTIVGFYRVKMNSNENAENLFTLEGTYPILYRIKPYGRYVLFQMGEFLNEEGTEFSISLYAYDTEGDGKITCLCKNIARQYTVDNSALYYCDRNDNVYKKEFSNDEAVLLFKQEVISEEDRESSPKLMFLHEDTLVYEVINYNTEGQVHQYVFDLNGNLKQIFDSQYDNLIRPY